MLLLKVDNAEARAFYEAEPCLKWWKKHDENERAWKVAAKDILGGGCDLDIKNPSAKQDFEHLRRNKGADFPDAVWKIRPQDQGGRQSTCDAIRRFARALEVAYGT